ncbi:MAG TPA: tetratricopeptide repeat protein [Bacteroidia bacterium]|nr:tetratricopeptide repeat protein [Bacteroidia bacterium]
MFKAIGVFVLASVVFPMGLLAQKTMVYSDPVSHYNRGLDLYDKEHYGSAIGEFEEYLKISRDAELRINAEYYAAVSSLILEHQGAEARLEAFANNYPAHIKANLTWYQLGRHYYNAGNYSKALTFLKKTNDEALTFDESLEYHFMLGYSEFRRNKMEDAVKELTITSNDKTKYYYPSHYYLGYIYLQQGNYPRAQQHFDKLKGSKVYGAEVGLYMAIISFGQGKYDELLAVTDTMKTGKNKREIGWMRGQAYYYMDRFAEALPLLEENQPSRNKMDANDRYMLGYAYYANKNYNKAFEEFTTINNTKDTITQYAYYNAAESFLHLDRKTNARDAFYQASLLGFNQKLKERSMFNYAKLSYDLGFNSEALNMLKKFIKEYPKSDLVTEAKTLQGEVLLGNSDYQEAIEVLESIDKMNDQTQRVYQQITFFRAIQLMGEGVNKGDEAFKYLEKAKKYPWDKKIDAMADFWKGEISYNKNKYWDCIKYTRAFLDYKDAESTSVYEAAYYNIGYSYVKIAELEKDYNTLVGHYQKAADNFKVFTQEVKFTNQDTRYLDGMSRLADCYFVLKNYDAALESYNFIITKNAVNADYGYFQKGLIFGLQDKNDAKISTLKKIAESYPRSSYVEPSLYEIALVHLKKGNLADAERGFNYLLGENPRGPFARKCHLRLGVVYYQQDNYDKAKKHLQTVIEDYGSYQEADEAAGVLESVYKDLGDIDGFFTYMADKGKKKYDANYQDKATYDAAFQRYQDEDCKEAIREFGNYINKFPNGNFIVEANYYKANCDYKEQKLDDALKGFLFTLDKNRPEWEESATRYAATIYYLQKDYANALPMYERLEGIATLQDNKLVSLLGQTRCSYYVGNDEKTVNNSKKLLAYNKVTREGIIEANLYLARIYVKQAKWEEVEGPAKEILKLTTNQYGAEAKYYIALTQYNKNRPADAEKTILDVVKNFASYDYWKAKALLLNADILIDKKDLFQARAILKSIIDGYENEDDGIVDEAEEKLTAIGEGEETEEE